MSDTHKLLRITAKVLSGRVFGRILGLITVMLCTRVLVADQYGRFLYVFSIVNIIAILSNLGMTEGLISFIPKYIVSKDLDRRNSTVTFALLLNILVVFLIYFGLYIIWNGVTSTLLKGETVNSLLFFKILPLILLISTSQIIRYALRGNGEVKYFVTSMDIILPSIRMAGIILFYKSMSGLNVLILSYYCAYFVVLLYLLYGLMKASLLAPLRRAYIRDYKKFIQFSLPLLFSRSIVLSLSQIDTLMIGYFMMPANVAVYRVLVSFSRVVSLILSSLNVSFSPKISELYHRGSKSEIEKNFRTLAVWTSFFGFLVFGYVMLDGQLALRFIFGEYYITGYWSLVMVSFGQLINAITGTVGPIQIMTGHPIQYMKVQVFNIILKTGLNWLLIPLWGINGAAMSTMLCLCSVNLLMVWMVYKSLGIHPFSKTCYKIFSATGIAFTIMWFVKKRVLISGIGGMLLNLTGYVMVFSICAWLNGSVKFRKSRESYSG